MEFQARVVLVMKGTTNANTQWSCTNSGSIQLGTTNITFAKTTRSLSFSSGSNSTIWPTGLKRRVQPSETLVLSDYSTRQDDPLIPPNPNMLKVFQGAGVASSWRLEIPRSVNDVDFGALTDVRLTFYYWARFDPDLRDRVLARLGAIDHFNARQQALPLRWVYPDAFFQFQNSGQLSFTLGVRDFPLNVTNPQLTNIGILVTTDKTIPPSGIAIGLATPNHTAVTGTSDASGQILSNTKDATGKDLAGPYAALIPAPVLGVYTLTITAGSNPGLVTNGQLNLQPIINLGVLLGIHLHSSNVALPGCCPNIESARRASRVDPHLLVRNTAMSKPSGTSDELLNLPSGGGSVSGAGVFSGWTSTPALRPQDSTWSCLLAPTPLRLPSVSLILQAMAMDLLASVGRWAY